MNDTTTQSGDQLRTLTPREARYKAALEEIRSVAQMWKSQPAIHRLYNLAAKALEDESTFAP